MNERNEITKAKDVEVVRDMKGYGKIDMRSLQLHYNRFNIQRPHRFFNFARNCWRNLATFGSITTRR